MSEESTDNFRRLYSGSGRDVELTELGQQQALALGAHLSERRVSRLFVSPMKRTRATAAPISGAWPEAEVVFSELLVERHFGSTEGRSVYADIALSDAESSGAVTVRVGEFYRSLLLPEFLAEDAPGVVVVVSHGMTIAKLLPVILSDFEYTPSVPVAMLPNAGYHMLDIDCTSRKIRSSAFRVNSHLAGVKTAKALKGAQFDSSQTRIDSFFKK